MLVPDCYDPAVQEDRRQGEWDRRCAASPRCSCCNGSVYPYDTFTEIILGETTYLFCEKCVSRGTRSIEDLEGF